MKNINLLFGLILFIGFLISGWYMENVFVPENLTNLTARMELRANHIYIVLLSFINILSFKIELSKSRLSRLCDTTFRVLLLISGLITAIAFLNEHTGDLNERIFEFYIVLSALIAVSIVLLNEIWTFIINRKSA